MSDATQGPRPQPQPQDTGVVPLPKKEGGLPKGCVTAAIVVLVLFVAAAVSALFGFFVLADKASDKTEEVFGSTTCSLVTDDELSAAVGQRVDAFQFGSATGLGMQLADNRVTLDGDGCLASGATSDTSISVSKVTADDASDLFAAQFEAAKGTAPSSSEPSGPMSASGPYLDAQFLDIGDEAFCTLPDPLGYSGVLVREGDTLVYASVVPPDPAASQTERCEMAQAIAQAVLD